MVLKSAVLAPMPMARIRTATAANPLFFQSVRKVYRMS